jgi:hypothetical protein
VMERTDSAGTIQLREAIVAIDRAATELCAGLSTDQLSWRPRVGRWSIVENLAHLRITTQVFLPAVDVAIEKSKELQLRSDGPFRLTPYGNLLVWRMEARPILKMRAPQAVQPQLLQSSAQELGIFLQSQAEMRKRIEDAKGLNITALRFTSPLARYLQINLLELFSMFNAHSRRHLWQAGRVRQAMLGTRSVEALELNAE